MAVPKLCAVDAVAHVAPAGEEDEGSVQVRVIGPQLLPQPPNPGARETLGSDGGRRGDPPRPAAKPTVRLAAETVGKDARGPRCHGEGTM